MTDTPALTDPDGSFAAMRAQMGLPLCLGGPRLHVVLDGPVQAIFPDAIALEHAGALGVFTTTPDGTPLHVGHFLRAMVRGVYTHGLTTHCLPCGTPGVVQTAPLVPELGYPQADGQYM